MQQFDWKILIGIREPQNAYTHLHNIISKIYDVFFPYKKYATGYISRKPWITTAIRESIKRKINYMLTEIKGLTLHSNGIITNVIALN